MNKQKTQFIINTPPNVWIFLGFLLTYIFFFLCPTFFSSNVMQFSKYLPALKPIGTDLKQILSYSESWFIYGHTPYVGANIYPPLASILFTPFIFISFSLAYIIITLITVFCYIAITFFIPFKVHKEEKILPLLILIFITGLFSYCFQFELERGQFNVIAMFFCFFSIWIFHFKNKYRYVAYFLFIISVQLKIYPFIFIFMFVTDWHDWMKNIRRFLSLSFLNLILFFVLGFNVFSDFFEAVIKQTKKPYSWKGNHSIQSFANFIYKQTNVYNPSGINHYLALRLILYAITCACIFLVILYSYRRGKNGFNPYLLLACTIGALVIPSVSHDYSLSILSAPIAVLVSDKHFISLRSVRLRGHIFHIVTLTIFSFAFFSTLFSYINKPLIFKNNFPALMIILLITTFLFLKHRNAKVMN